MKNDSVSDGGQYFFGVSIFDGKMKRKIDCHQRKEINDKPIS